MDTQWTNPELTASAPNSHLGMSDHQRSFVGPHAMPGLPVMDHWPSPPIAHSHHINNGNNNGNSNNSLSNNNNNSTGPCIQNQCKMPNDVDTSSMLENNSSSILIKSGDCPVINDNNNKSNRNNNNNNNNNSDSTNQSDGDGHPTRQNHIGSVVLHGVAIVSLIIDNKERLCLAQISNTLLKEYSYNEIHNRRVALGITCVQCTPVQLEILRRAGAMPVSSRRCGMITKREAERLVKSFLEDNAPPKLPEDFAFDVIHDCGWGCRGLFEPARYNSSRAKCIKCMYCSMYFSPNKFIFHFHRTPGAKYNHPDAANFNSWRRHLKLYQVQDKDELTFKWEDVKAMFNGGTRKKIGSSSSSSSSAASPSSSSLSNSKFSPHLSSSHHHHHSHHHHQSVSNRTSSYQHSPSTLDGASSAKKAKTSMMDANSFLPKPAPFSNLFNPYGWLTASHNKAAAYPFMTMNSAQSMCFGFPPQIPANKDALMDRMKSAPVGVGNPTGWMNRNPVAPFQLASMDLLWDKTFGFPSAAAVAALGGFRNGAYPNSIFPGAPNPMGMEMSEHLSPPRDNTPCISPNPGMPHKMMASPGCHERGEKGGNRMSAFTRVVPSMSPPSSASLSPQHSNTDRNTPSRNEDDDDDIDHNTEEADGDYGHVHDNKCLKTENGQTNIFACDFSTHRDIDDSEEIDVEEDSDDKKRLKCSNQRDLCQGQPCNPIQPTPVSQHSYSQHVVPEEGHLHPSHHPTASSPSLGPSRHSVSPLMRSDDDCGRGRENRSPGHESTVSDESDTERDNQDHPRDMIKEDVHGEDTKSEKDDRKDEEEVTGLKDPYREDVGREKTFQEHMSKQLEMLRETLTTELEQERKIRYSLQEKLKQAHEALNSFSCGLLTANGDSNSFKDTNPVPR